MLNDRAREGAGLVEVAPVSLPQHESLVLEGGREGGGGGGGRYIER